MFQNYRLLFQAKGSYAFSISGFFARIPIGMMSLAIITMFAASGRNYSEAGILAASYVLANAFLAPIISRLSDQYGQAKVARPATFISYAAICSLIIGFHYNLPFYLLIASAIIAGFMPSYGAFVRARWSSLYNGKPLMRIAFAFESIIDEIIFMVGPIIAIEISQRFFPAAGLLIAAFIALIGGFIFTSYKDTEPKIYKKSQYRRRSVIWLYPVQLLTWILFFIGIIFGASEIMTVAMANSLNLSKFSALPLSFYALGSFLAGIFYGTLPVKMPLARQLLFSLSIAAITTIPLLFVTNLWQLSFILLLAGAACSPTIIISMSLIEAIAPREQLTEGMTWATTGMFVGLAFGSAISGYTIDHFHLKYGFIIAFLGGFTALLLAFISYNYLKTKTTLKRL